MADMVLERKQLPKAIFSWIKSDKIKVHQENDSITLTPFSPANEYSFIEQSCGMLADTGITVDSFLDDMRNDRELEH
jgi:hypothetical protein